MAEKTAGITVYLMEELTDARLRCEQLKGFVDQAVRLISNSPQKAHFYEVAGNLLHGIPDTLFRLDKALDATALAASRLDYEELKQQLRPEKVQELENALKDVRIRRFDRRAPQVPQEMTMRKLATGSDVVAALRHIANAIEAQEQRGEQPSTTKIAQALETVIGAMTPSADEARRSRFEEGKPADPTENMDEGDAKKWKTEHDKNKDNFKSASRIVPLEEAKKGDMVEVELGVPWPNDSKKEKFTGKVVRVKSTALTVDFTKSRSNPDGHSNEDVGQIDVRLPKKKSANMIVDNVVVGSDPSTSITFTNCTFKSASDEDHFSKYEEGKPADPTENMSDEDAKKWKIEHLKNKDNFKAADVDEPLHLLTAFDGIRVQAVAAYKRAATKNYRAAFVLLQKMVWDIGDLMNALEMDGAQYASLLGQAIMRGRGHLQVNDLPETVTTMATTMARFETGKPADPTQNMTDDDAAKWKAMNEEHGDKFKTAGA